MAKTNLYQASNQWSTRPVDETFESLEDMRNACHGYAQSAKVVSGKWGDLRVENDSDHNMYLTGNRGIPAKFTHYSFGQLCRSLSAPADFIRDLSPTSASLVLNERLARQTELRKGEDAKLLLHSNGSYLVRAITSQVYDFTWNYKVLDRMVMPLLPYGWRVPPARPSPARENDPRARPATEADVIPHQEDFGLSVKVGDMIAPAGLYASDRDMFVFLVLPKDGLSIGPRQLMRGLMIENTEVADGRALTVRKFELDNVCGNHICWGAQDVQEVSVKHVAGRGKQNQDVALERLLDRFEVTCQKWEDDRTEKEGLIQRAQTRQIAATQDEVIDTLYKWAKKEGYSTLTKKCLTAGYETAEQHTDWYGSPRTVWGMVSGLTQHSQTLAYQDARQAIDAAAGELLSHGGAF